MGDAWGSVNSIGWRISDVVSMAKMCLCKKYTNFPFLVEGGMAVFLVWSGIGILTSYSNIFLHIFICNCIKHVRLLIPEPTARSAVPGVSPGRGLLILY